MSEQASKIDELDPQTQSAGGALKQAYALLLETGHSPASIVAASMLATINLMEAEGLTGMQITNRFIAFFDEMRNQLFSKPN